MSLFPEILTISLESLSEITHTKFNEMQEIGGPRPGFLPPKQTKIRRLFFPGNF